MLLHLFDQLKMALTWATADNPLGISYLNISFKGCFVNRVYFETVTAPRNDGAQTTPT